MVMDVPCSGGDILTSVTVRVCCAGATGSDELCCADAPGSKVVFVGGAIIFVRLSCHWGTFFVVTGTVSGTNPCEPGAGETISLRFALWLI